MVIQALTRICAGNFLLLLALALWHSLKGPLCDIFCRHIVGMILSAVTASV